MKVGRIGKIIEIRLSDLNPAQPDDRLHPIFDRNKPIEIYRDRGRWFILNGNHRYYRALDISPPSRKIRAKIASNPYKL